MKFSRSIRIAALFAASMAIVVATLPAQRLGPPPKRPKNNAIADTNDSRAYFDYAMTEFEKNPSNAAAAFYWAARIDPTSASALYGRAVSLIMSNRGMMNDVMYLGRRKQPTKQQLAVDSLYLRARTIDPFLFTQLEKRLMKAYLLNLNGGSGGDLEIDFLIESYLRSADIYTRAFVAYNEGEFARALSLYADAMKNVKEKAGYYVERGRTFALVGNADSAIAQFNQALDEMRKKDNKELVVLYNSKAVIEHSIGTLLERSGKVAEAREAYGKALQEDLSFYPAHLRLGLLAVDARDTTTALSEHELAAQIATEEPHVFFNQGYALFQFGKYADAIKALTKATTLEPYYARPYAILGESHEKTGDKAAALAAYENFLKYSSRRDPDRPSITQKHAALSKAL